MKATRSALSASDCREFASSLPGEARERLLHALLQQGVLDIECVLQSAPGSCVSDPDLPATLKLAGSLGGSDPDLAASLDLAKSLQDEDEANSDACPFSATPVNQRISSADAPFQYPRVSAPRERTDPLAPPVAVANRYDPLVSPPSSPTRIRPAAAQQDVGNAVGVKDDLSAAAPVASVGPISAPADPIREAEALERRAAELRAVAAGEVGPAGQGGVGGGSPWTPIYLTTARLCSLRVTPSPNGRPEQAAGHELARSRVRL